MEWQQPTPSSDAIAKSAFGSFADSPRRLHDNFDQQADAQEVVLPQPVQPRPQGPVAVQVQSVKAGLGFVPVDDDNHDHNHDHDHDDGGTTQTKTEADKGPDLMHQHDHWGKEKQAELDASRIALKDLQEEFARYRASVLFGINIPSTPVTKDAKAIATPMIKNIYTPNTFTNDYQADIDFGAIRSAIGDNNGNQKAPSQRMVTAAGILRDRRDSHSDEGTPFAKGGAGSLNQLGGWGPPGGGDGGAPGGGDDDDEEIGTGRITRDSYYREFTLVSPSKINILLCIGTNLIIKFYMHVNKAIRKLIRAQGPMGISLLRILIDVEIYGSEPYDNNKFTALQLQCRKAVEYKTAIMSVLETYTSDIAEGMIRYGVHNGFDAWRRLYNHYMSS